MIKKYIVKIIPRLILAIFLAIFYKYITYGNISDIEKLPNIITSNSENLFKFTESLGDILTITYLIIKFGFIIIFIILVFKYFKKNHITKNQLKNKTKNTIVKNLKIKYIRLPKGSVQFSVYDGSIEYISDKIPIKKFDQNNNCQTNNKNFSVGKGGLININGHTIRRGDIVTIYINPNNSKNYWIDTDFLHE